MTSGATPLVSVVVPAFNQGRYLADAIHSAVSQTYTNLEVIVVDDGSTDDTRDIVRRISDPRLRYVHQENRGLSAARNTGIRHALGSFLSFLDADDLFCSEKLARLLNAFVEKPELGFVAGQAILVDEQGVPLGERFERPVPDESTEWLLGNPLHVGSVLLRREWQERVGFFDEELRSYEDWDMWLRLARAGCPMGWVPYPVSQYRFHRAQMTRLGEQMTTATFAVLQKTLRDTSLPESWRLRQDEAYSRAYLRAAAQAYTAQEFSHGRECLREAVRLDGRLIANSSEKLAGIVAGWANHAKTPEPLRYLQDVYSHLPDELWMLRQRRRNDVGRVAVHLAFEAYRRGDGGETLRLLARAVRLRPQLLFHSAVLRLLLQISVEQSRRAFGLARAGTH